MHLLPLLQPLQVQVLGEPVPGLVPLPLLRTAELVLELRQAALPLLDVPALRPAVAVQLQRLHLHPHPRLPLSIQQAAALLQLLLHLRLQLAAQARVCICSQPCSNSSRGTLHTATATAMGLQQPQGRGDSTLVHLPLRHWGQRRMGGTRRCQLQLQRRLQRPLPLRHRQAVVAAQRLGQPSLLLQQCGLRFALLRMRSHMRTLMHTAMAMRMVQALVPLHLHLHQHQPLAVLGQVQGQEQAQSCRSTSSLGCCGHTCPPRACRRCWVRWHSSMRSA